MTAIPAPPGRFKYHVLLSYSSKDASYVHAVREALLQEKVKVFDYAEERFLGESLNKGIERRYKNEALFCAVFISEEYLDVSSTWTKKEFAIVLRVAKQKPGYMLPLLLGVKAPDEIEDIAWLDVGYEQSRKISPVDLAASIVTKILDPPPKQWWFYVSWQVKLAIAAALFALILFARPIIDHFRPSRTSVLFTGATEQAITVHVANTGPNNATIVGQRLKFGGLPIEDSELRIDKSSATIAPGGRDVRLTVLTLQPRCTAGGHRLDSAEIVPLLDTQNVILEVNVQESDDAPGHPSIRPATIPGARLKPFVGKWVPGNVDPNC